MAGIAAPTRAEFAEALAGVRALVRLDARGLGHFENSHRGFWMSFWAAPILAPLVAIDVVRYAAEYPPPSLWRYVAYQLIAYALGWLAFPLAMVWIADHLGRRQRYFGYFAAYNWFQLAETAASTAIVLLGIAGLVPGEAEFALDLVLQVAFLYYGWFIARHALALEGGTAAMVVAVDFLLGLLIARGSLSLP